jgi:hypothetical protein
MEASFVLAYGFQCVLDTGYGGAALSCVRLTSGWGAQFDCSCCRRHDLVTGGIYLLRFCKVRVLGTRSHGGTVRPSPIMDLPSGVWSGLGACAGHVISVAGDGDFRLLIFA